MRKTPKSRPRPAGRPRPWLSDAFDIPGASSIPAALLSIAQAAGEAMADLVKELLSDFWGALAEAIPGLSIVYSAVRFAHACKKAYGAHAAQTWLINEFENSLADDSPRVAIQALRQLYHREKNQAEINAARFAGSFAVGVSNAATLGLLTPVSGGICRRKRGFEYCPETLRTGAGLHRGSQSQPIDLGWGPGPENTHDLPVAGRVLPHDHAPTAISSCNSSTRTNRHFSRMPYI